jgi:hypothetical protein
MYVRCTYVATGLRRCLTDRASAAGAARAHTNSMVYRGLALWPASCMRWLGSSIARCWYMHPHCFEGLRSYSDERQAVDVETVPPATPRSAADNSHDRRPRHQHRWAAKAKGQQRSEIEPARRDYELSHAAFGERPPSGTPVGESFVPPGGLQPGTCGRAGASRSSLRPGSCRLSRGQARRTGTRMGTADRAAESLGLAF